MKDFYVLRQSKVFNQGSTQKADLMSQATIERELKLIRQRLEAIEESLAEEMTEEDKRDLKEAIVEHRRGKSVPFGKVRKF